MLLAALIRGQARKGCNPYCSSTYYYYYYYYSAKVVSLFSTFGNLIEGYVRVQEKLIT